MGVLDLSGISDSERMNIIACLLACLLANYHRRHHTLPPTHPMESGARKGSEGPGETRRPRRD